MNLKNFCKACGKKLDFPNAEGCPNCSINFEKDCLYYFEYCPICGNKIDMSMGFPIEICPECGVRINRKFEFFFSEFIKENSSLLTISSIFIALAVYLTQIAVSVNKTDYTFLYSGIQFNVLDLSVGASLLLSLLILGVIIKKIVSEFFRIRVVNLAQRWYSISGLKITLIFTLFCFLFTGLFLYFYLTYKMVVLIFLIIIIFSVCPIIEMGLKKLFTNIIQKTEITRSHENHFYIIFLGGATILLYLLYTLSSSSTNAPIRLLSIVLFIVFILILLDFVGNLWIFLMTFIWKRIEPKIF
jgi:hypothetical protein